MNLNVEEIKSNYSLEDLENLKQLLDQICEDKRRQASKCQNINAFSREYLEYIRNTFSKSYLKSVKLSLKHLSDYFGNEKLLRSLEVGELEKFKIHLIQDAP